MVSRGPAQPAPGIPEISGPKGIAELVRNVIIRCNGAPPGKPAMPDVTVEYNAPVTNTVSASGMTDTILRTRWLE